MNKQNKKKLELIDHLLENVNSKEEYESLLKEKVELKNAK